MISSRMHFFQMNFLYIPVPVGIYLLLGCQLYSFSFLCLITRIARSNISLISTGAMVLILATDYAHLDFKMRFIRNIMYIQNPTNHLSSPYLGVTWKNFITPFSAPVLLQHLTCHVLPYLVS